MRQESNYDLVLNFSDSIASGGSANASTRVDVEGFFEVESITGSIILPTTQGGAVAFTGLPRESSPTVANNTLPTVDCCQVQLSLNDGSWMQQPILFGAYVGTAEHPYYPRTPLRFPGGASLIGTLTNRGGGFTVQAQIVFHGRRISMS